MRPVLAAALLALLAGCGGSGAGTTTATRPRPAAPKIHVKLTAQSHHPRVGKPWRYEVRVTDGAGKPVAASVHLQILFAGVPVGQIGRHRVADGIWRETIGAGPNPPFPERARGQALVFQAVVRARGETARASYWIRVQ